jgi:hypothetical protein
MREVDRRLKKSAKGNEAAKSKTTNYGKCGGKCGGRGSSQRRLETRFFHLPVGSSQLGNGVDGTRFSDEQLYALALYLYSLKPPPNPNRFDDRARRGQQIFPAARMCGVSYTSAVH